MFAFAIWDDKARTLFVARDRAGKKPLYYTTTPNGTFVFGSELKSLLEHPDVEREINPEALDAYFTLGLCSGSAKHLPQRPQTAAGSLPDLY